MRQNYDEGDVQGGEGSRAQVHVEVEKDDVPKETECLGVFPVQRKDEEVLAGGMRLEELQRDLPRHRIVKLFV